MATALAAVDDREVVRCDNSTCNLVQFKNERLDCRRCHTPFANPEPEPEPVIAAEPAVDKQEEIKLGRVIRIARETHALSQRQLALRMGVPRTYVSKIENNKATPTLSSLERLAKALDIHVSLLIEPELRERNELFNDPLVAELLPFVHGLTSVQMDATLAWCNTRRPVVQ